MRNLPFPASGNPSARFADANANDGNKLPRTFQILFVCNHLRNLPFPASGNPSARFATRMRTTATSCRADSKNFLFVIICGICRFPQAGIPRQDSLTRIRTTANLVCRVDSAQGQQKTRSQHLMCWLRVFLVAPCGIEPQILP